MGLEETDAGAGATDFCRLRPLRPSDAAALAALAGDLEVARMTARVPHPYGVAEAERFLAGLGEAEVALGVEIGAGEAAELAGVAGWKRDPAGAQAASGDVGYWLGRAFWGRGLATTAGRLLVEEAARDPALTELRACVFQDNPASARVLEKIGFTYVGVCKGWSEARGRTDPTWLYRRAAPEREGAR